MKFSTVFGASSSKSSSSIVPSLVVMTAVDTAATLAAAANLPPVEASLHFEGGDGSATRGGFQQAELSNELASQWRRLTRVATAVALLTAPAVVVWLNQTQGWAWYWSILAALLVVVCFRGVVDLLFHRMIPRPSLFGLESQRLREEGRRRAAACLVLALLAEVRDRRRADPSLPFYFFRGRCICSSRSFRSS